MTDPMTPNKTAAQRQPGWPVIFFLPARLIFSALAQGLTAILLAWSGADAPLLRAAGWWPVFLSLADGLCLAGLVWLTRREGKTLIDLVGARGRAAARQLAWVPVMLAAMLPAAGLARVITQLFYGSAPPPMFTVLDLPLAGRLYALLVWPVIWSITEELVYLGYLLPRLEALTGRTWPAALAVIFFWGLQHLANPFLPDATYLLSRVLAAFAAVGGMTVVFLLLRRRLVAMMGVHYLFDLITGVMIFLS